MTLPTGSKAWAIRPKFSSIVNMTWCLPVEDNNVAEGITQFLLFIFFNIFHLLLAWLEKSKHVSVFTAEPLPFSEAPKAWNQQYLTVSLDVEKICIYFNNC